MGFLSGTVAKGLPANTGDTGAVGLIPASGRLPGGGNVFLLVFLYSQYSCWENPVNRGACWATIHGVSKSLTWLSDWAYIHTHFTKYYQGYRVRLCWLQSQFVVQVFSPSVIFDSLWPLELQRTRLPCPSPSPRAYSNSCPLSQWCHPTISFSVIPFSSCLQPFPTPGSFLMSRLSHQVAKVLELQLHHQSFQWIFRIDLL